MKEITENIKKFRELKNFSREVMADKLEMSLSGYSKLERGDVLLKVNKLFKLAELLEVSVSQILNFDASQIFNVKDYGVAYFDIHSQTNNYTDPYKDKYIQLLEAEVARLKKLEEK